MFSPVLAASNEPVLRASADGAARYLFFYFFHISIYITTWVLFEVKVREIYAPGLYDPTKEVIKRFGK